MKRLQICLALFQIALLAWTVKLNAETRKLVEDEQFFREHTQASIDHIALCVSMLYDN